MHNELIVALSNRTLGFSFDGFNVFQHFTAVNTVGIKELRNILIKKDIDIWYIALINIIRSQQLVKLDLGDLNFTFSFSEFSLQTSLFDTAILVESGEGPPYVGGYPYYWDNSTVIVKYYTADKVVIEFNNKRYTSDITVTGNLISLNWPKEIPIVGNILLNAPYSPATTVTMNLPLEYPVDKVVKEIEESKSVEKLLSDNGMLENFYYADSNAEKVAIAGYTTLLEFRKHQ